MKDFILNLDRPRKLIYDFDAWDIIAEKYGPKDKKKAKEDFDPLQLKATYAEMPFLVYAGLLWEDAALDEPKVRNLLNQSIRSGKHTIMDVMQMVVNAIFAQSGLEEIPIKEAVEKMAADAKKKILESSSPETGSEAGEKQPRG